MEIPVREPQELPERVSIGTDGVGARPALLDQALGKEALQQWSEAGCADHDRFSQRRSSRRMASPINSGEASRYHCVSAMYMPQVGRQHRQEALRVLLAAIPVHQCAGRERMSKVMQTRSVAVVLAPQPDLARQRVESTSDLRTVKPVSPTGDEQVRRHRTTGPMTLAPGDVIGEDLARGAVQRNQTGPAELGLTHRQYGGVEVDIPELEIACFGHTETGHGQLAEQAGRFDLTSTFRL